MGLGTATSTFAYCVTSILVPFAVIDFVPVGIIYSEGIGSTVTGPYAVELATG